ncbi:GNAT family N-acetyltransferase [Planococcus sp. A6]|uniref:GNAT family N-acetyltransferase n=1 Tax=Planococcus sp. A6 TaxID=2992760 RepID=UPI00237AF51C|nr:GNAT family N-acetyltransferase [Planococcus sp. A6]MDE0584018.1 GNAT family N-acetyltransferase [Planococcus sp. A6]
MLTTRGAKILDGTPNYLVMEEIGEIESAKHFEEVLNELKKHVVEKDIQSVSIILNEQQAEYIPYRELLEKFSFQIQDTQFFYRRQLSALEDMEIKAPLSVKSLEEIKEDVFLKTWMDASAGSLNASAPFTSLSAQKEFEGMQSELGAGYQKSCLVIFYGDQAIGVTMPQIEKGTVDEGRLFYFGLIPAFRGMGWGAYLHKLSLQLLKQMGAEYYIGATGQHNIPMQRIFEANACELIEKKFIYRLKDGVK